MSTVLIIAAHPNDEILDVGGTVAKHVAMGDKVFALILGEGQTSRFEVRDNAPKALIDDLHHDSILAGRAVGFEKVLFENLPDNRFDTLDLLDVVKKVEKIISELRPNIVYTHHGGDLNIDHQITYQAVLTATRPVNPCSVKELYTFETLSSTEWNFLGGKHMFVPNVFIDVEEYFQKKVEAMKCYKSELCEFPHPRSVKGMEVLAQKWGSVVGKQYVEAFQLIRKIVE